MLYLDVEVLSEAIRRVGKWSGSMDQELVSPEAATLIALIYERLIRGEVPWGFLDLFSERNEMGRI